MKVLVCAASKYGATRQIAQAVADVLSQRGCEVTVLPPERWARWRSSTRLSWTARATWASG
jgi:menaquinone-dependent protoporphyrinogen IX oxidase